MIRDERDHLARVIEAEWDDGPYGSGIDSAARIVREWPVEEAPTSPWIRVEDRLPEHPPMKLVIRFGSTHEAEFLMRSVHVVAEGRVLIDVADMEDGPITILISGKDDAGRTFPEVICTTNPGPNT